MRKVAAILLILSALAVPAFSQSTLPFNEFKKGFEDFAEDVASVLPMNSTIGLNWSDAYIGQFLALPPSFGVGLTMGFTAIPYDAIKSIMVDTLGGDEGEIPDVVKDIGLPLPAFAFDARIGGFVFPFDIGFKIGFIPKTIKDQIGDNLDIDYLLIGGDVRYLLMKQRFVVIPEVSVGLGFNYLKGSVTFRDVMPDITITDLSGTGLPGTLALSSPEFNIEWTTKVFDLKAQASWSLLILQPSVGLGASYGVSTVSGGVKSDLLYNGVKITEPTLAVLRAAGYEVDNLGIAVSSDVTGWSFRGFLGLSVNILILRIDAGIQYNFIGQNLGASIGGRIQL